MKITVAFILSLFLASYLFADGTDCPLLGHLPTYSANTNNERKGVPQMSDFDSHDIQVPDKDPVTVKGKLWTQQFQIMPGNEELSPLEVTLNYKDQMEKLGSTIVFQSKSQIAAKLSKDGVTTWMDVSCDGGFANTYTVFIVQEAPFKPTLTTPGTNDYRLLGHMPGYSVATSDKKNFDEYAFPVNPDATTPVQGKIIHIDYQSTARPQPASDLEVTENYAAAILAQGGQLLVHDAKNVIGRIDENGRQIWVHLTSVYGDINLTVVEEKPFQATIQPPSTDAMKAALEKEGHIALHVNFDFAKDTLKPDAAPVITQVVSLLKANPSYQLVIEGHTDNVGGADFNQKLSERRAAAVVDALVKGGIAKDRLSSIGLGDTKPVASNDTSEGRASNRRVELVKK